MNLNTQERQTMDQIRDFIVHSALLGFEPLIARQSTSGLLRSFGASTMSARAKPTRA